MKYISPILLLIIIIGCNKSKPHLLKDNEYKDSLAIENELPIGNISLIKYSFPEKWENLSQIDDTNINFNIDNISEKGFDSIFYFIEKNASLFYDDLKIKDSKGRNFKNSVISDMGLNSKNIILDSAYFVKQIAVNDFYSTNLFKSGKRYDSLLIGDSVQESYNYLVLVTIDRKNKPIDYKVIYFTNMRFEHSSRYFFIDNKLNIYTKDFFTDELYTSFLKSNKIFISKAGIFSKNIDVNSNSPKNLKKNSIEVDNNIIGSYHISTDALSNYDQSKIKLEYFLSFESNKKAILSIGAEQVQDYGCEGEYKLSSENNILHAKGKCDQEDVDDFYIKKENDQVYIKSKRFINKDWQKLSKSK